MMIGEDNGTVYCRRYCLFPKSVDDGAVKHMQSYTIGYTLSDVATHLTNSLNCSRNL